MRHPILGRGRFGGARPSPPAGFMEEPAAQFPPNHLLAPSGLRNAKQGA
ncbi:MAG: hypothetical protein HYW48_09645 [Deltaproteobacteria bacterium]|nr:hypothetical protein [Deltaproteobacteria bacterium]